MNACATLVNCVKVLSMRHNIMHRMQLTVVDEQQEEEQEQPLPGRLYCTCLRGGGRLFGRLIVANTNKTRETQGNAFVLAHLLKHKRSYRRVSRNLTW
jgi:hypothetical protein